MDGEASIGRCVAFVDNERYEQLMAKKAEMPKTKHGDAYNSAHVAQLNKLSEAFVT